MLITHALDVNARQTSRGYYESFSNSGKTKRSIVDDFECNNDREVEEIEVAQIGKKGEITQLSKLIGGLPPNERRDFGQAVNIAKKAVLEAIAKRRDELFQKEVQRKLADDSFDPTRADFVPHFGGLHPLTVVQRELEEIFTAMGFMVLDYPEIEDEFHNFEA